MLDAIDFQEYFVEMPFIAGSRTSSPQAIGIRFAELLAPPSDRFVTDEHAAGRHQLFDIAKAYAETEVEPDAMRDDLSRKPVTAVQAGTHSFSIASGSYPRTGQRDSTP